MGVVSFEKYKLKKSRSAASRLPPSAPISAGRARLLEATRNLHKAALKQHAIACEFRDITLELGKEIKNLEKSAIRLNRNVRRIRIKPLNRSAKNLADTMDSLLSTRRS